MSAGFLATGCSLFHPPDGPQGAALGFQKRIGENLTRDFLHHWQRTVYRAPDTGPKGDLANLSPVQHNIVQEWGKPDYIRPPFQALTGEVVTEWLFSDREYMFQFVGEELVYEGPITDYEHILLVRGYPDEAEYFRMENDKRVDLLIYYKLFEPGFHVFKLDDGRIKHAQEGS